MIETALVSGKYEDAFFFEGGDWYWISAGGTETVCPSEVRRAVNGPGEYSLLTKVTRSELLDAITTEKRKADALFLCCAALDEEISISTRVLIAEEADKILSDSDTKTFVLTRILSWPLPATSMANRHSLMQVARSFDTLAAVLQEVFRLQPEIHEITSRWRDSAIEAGLPESTISSLRSDLIDSGFFRSVLNGLAARDLHSINSTIVSKLLSADLSPQERTLFLDFQKRMQSASHGGRIVSKGRTGLLFKHADDTQARSVGKGPFRPVFEEGQATTQRRRGALETKQKVDRQIQAIKEMLFRDRLPLAEKSVTELMRFQLSRDDQEYAVMSLCNLTSSALEANQLDFANELVNYATELGPTDPVPFTARAEVFRKRGQFAAALAAYEEALVRFQATKYPLNGKASVLSDMGRFQESIELFRSIQTDFPEDSVAFNGVVSVLRNQGRHRAALDLALANAKRFPLDPVTRGVLGGALSRVGRYSEASRHYQEAWRLDKSDERYVVGAALTMHSAGHSHRALQYIERFLTEDQTQVALQQAKAQILRSLGRISEAKQIYEGLIRAFPRYAPAAMGLRAITVLEDACSAAAQKIEADNLESELDWIGFRIFAVALVAAGRPEEAARKVKDAIHLCPWLHQRTRLETVLGIAEMKSRRTAGIQTLQSNLDKLEDRHKQVRLLLLSHAQILQNNQTVARVLLSDLITTKEPNVQSVRQHLIGLNGRAPTNVHEMDLSTGELELAMAA